MSPREASDWVNRYIKEGVMTRPTKCENCGAGPRQWCDRLDVIQLHHWDYDRPLDVIPLCRSCHFRVHRSGLPEPRTGRIYTSWRKEKP